MNKIITLFGIFFLISAQCSEPEKKSLQPLESQKVLKKIQADDITKFYKVVDGAITKKSNILLFVPGGPMFAFDITMANGYIKNTIRLTRSDTYDGTKAPSAPSPRSDYVTIVVLQEQMIRTKNKTIPTTRALTSIEARNINLHNIAMIYAVAEHFKKQGNKVTVYGISYGAFLLSEMYKEYGHSPFEKILIAAGRLDMPKKIVENTSKGIIARFKADGKTIIIGAKGDISNHNAGMLQADLGKNRYTSVLANKKLNKIIYYYGGRDSLVGALTDKEVKFLTDNDATVKVGINDDHDIASKINQVKADIEKSFQ